MTFLVSRKNHLYTCSTPAQVPISSLPQPCPKNDPASILADYFGTLYSRSPQFGAKCVVVWYRVLDVALPVGSHLVLLWGGLMRIALAQFSSSSPSRILCTVPAYYNVDSGHSHIYTCIHTKLRAATGIVIPYTVDVYSTKGLTVTLDFCHGHTVTSCFFLIVMECNPSCSS